MRRRSAFTLIEMLTTVAMLIIVLGLMVSLARYVRNRSAIQLTRGILTELSRQLDEYMARNHDQIPQITSIVLPNGKLPDEETILLSARQNNLEIIRALKSEARQQSAKQGESHNLDVFGQLPVSLYNNAALHDAWGNPIVFMAGMNPQIGMATPRHPVVGQTPKDEPFFFSSGPDRKFLTRDDNLYSYETTPVPMGDVRR